ncbi:MAG: hypothetical protein RMI56_06320 [Sulfolobales archaeon]|nr:hypothetical protein [Sulfolobales archaeon]MDW8083389.1 hypothetical protein [Sulfolobales archaeon]
MKISRELPYSMQYSNCIYFEISQGYYVGVLPGYIDAQCIYCDSELRCRYGLQKKVCSLSGYIEATYHLDIKQIRELVMKLSEVNRDYIWCITESGELLHSYL